MPNLNTHMPIPAHNFRKVALYTICDLEGVVKDIAESRELEGQLIASAQAKYLRIACHVQEMSDGTVRFDFTDHTGANETWTCTPETTGQNHYSMKTPTFATGGVSPSQMVSEAQVRLQKMVVNINKEMNTEVKKFVDNLTVEDIISYVVSRQA